MTVFTTASLFVMSDSEVKAQQLMFVSSHELQEYRQLLQVQKKISVGACTGGEAEGRCEADQSSDRTENLCTTEMQVEKLTVDRWL